MNLEGLDSRQQEVVNAVLDSSSKLLVLGGPGSGKTTTALWSARMYLESANEAPKPRALFLTFSRSSVGQVISRSPGVLSGYHDRVEIQTFHAVAYRLIRDFGRYAGYGTTLPIVESEARAKLLGRDGSLHSYDDLIVGAIRILKESARVRQLVAARWGLVICDEAQDTNCEQWKLLQLLGRGRMLFLGDINQMIYTWIPGVSPEQFQQIRESADKVIELLPQSHRDPSGAIPALAEAVRVRDFKHDAVIEALESGRLTIHRDIEDAAQKELLESQIKLSRQLGSRDVGVFAHSNVGVAEIAEFLDVAGIDHALIGIPEAHAEALGAMATQCAFAAGITTDEEVRESLALFLTATVRGREAPYLAQAFIGQASLPDPVENAIKELEQAVLGIDVLTIGDLASIAMNSWEGLRMTSGRRPWRRAAAHFRRLTAPVRDDLVSEESLLRLLEIVEQTRTEALIDRDYSEQGRIKLMTYHQTKGREADTVIHVFRSGDYFGPGGEPFEEASRLLNVAISRARKRVVVILPPNPHPLVEPFAGLKAISS